MRALIFIALLGCSLFMLQLTAYHQITTSLHHQLTKDLIPRLYSSKHHRISQYDMDQELHREINQDLEVLPLTGILPAFNHCTANLLPAGSKVASEITILHENEQWLFTLDCQLNYPVWLASGFASAVAGSLMLSLLPPPLNRRQRRWLRALQQQRIMWPEPVRQIRQLSPLQQQILEYLLELPAGTATSHLRKLPDLTGNSGPWPDTLSTEQVNRLADLIRYTELLLPKALEASITPPTLSLDPVNQSITVFGKIHTLPVTPFFYYLYYAMARSATEEGWIVNPASNRPADGGPLAELMERWGGNSKAINDLRGQGLKAKSLDQNRSRMKEELVAAVGERLAEPFLFDDERDLASGRSRYRLHLPAEKIRVITPEEDPRKISA